MKGVNFSKASTEGLVRTQISHSDSYGVPQANMMHRNTNHSIQDIEWIMDMNSKYRKFLGHSVV